MVTVVFFFKQKTAYESRISDWSSDVCSSDLCGLCRGPCVDGLGRSCGDYGQSQKAENDQKTSSGDAGLHKTSSPTLPASSPVPALHALIIGSHENANRLDRKSTRLNSSH